MRNREEATFVRRRLTPAKGAALFAYWLVCLAATLVGWESLSSRLDSSLAVGILLVVNAAVFWLGIPFVDRFVKR